MLLGQAYNKKPNVRKVHTRDEARAQDRRTRTHAPAEQADACAHAHRHKSKRRLRHARAWYVAAFCAETRLPVTRYTREESQTHPPCKRGMSYYSSPRTTRTLRGACTGVAIRSLVDRNRSGTPSRRSSAHLLVVRVALGVRALGRSALPLGWPPLRGPGCTAETPSSPHWGCRDWRTRLRTKRAPPTDHHMACPQGGTTASTRAFYLLLCRCSFERGRKNKQRRQDRTVRPAQGRAWRTQGARDGSPRRKRSYICRTEGPRHGWT